MDQELWRSPSGGSYTIQEVSNRVKNFIEQEPSCHYDISVGTDSQLKGKDCKFATVIVVHKIGLDGIGKGGQYYTLIQHDFYIQSFRQKIMKEASLTYNYKEIFKELLKDVLDKYSLHISPHVDAGDKGKTRLLKPEITSMFKGYGKEEEAVFKPDSFAASAIADKHSK